VLRSSADVALPLPENPADAARIPGPATVYHWTPGTLTVHDPDGHSRQQGFDAFGNVRGVIEYEDATGGYAARTTAYGYTIDGLIESVLDAKGTEISRVSYDPLGRRIRLVDRDSGTSQYEYDANDNAKDVIEGSGQSVTYRYDEIDRPSSACFWAKPQLGSICGKEIVFTWDVTQDASGAVDFGLGRIGEITDGYVTTRTRYDALGRPVRESRQIDGLAGEFTSDLEYDIGGRLRALVYPDSPRFRVQYDYHPGTGLLKSVTGNDGVVYATFSSYAANDQPRTVVRPATTSAYEFDGWTGNLKAIRAANAAGNLVNLEFAFTYGGRVSSVNDLVAGELRAYSYDGMGRLKTERSTVASAASAIPSAIPNLLFWPDALRPHALQSVTTPTANYEFTHDANGNVLSGYDVANSSSPQLRTFQYDTGALFDFLNMPAAITRSPGSPVQMLYDDAGVRARKGTGPGAVYYIGPHFEVRNGAYTKHVIANGVRLATISGGQTFHFYKDHRGSTVAATDPQGTTVWSGRYTSFGALLGESGVRPTPYLFTDHELDGETGLYYFGARYYDPAVGRFASADSLVTDPFAPQSLNRYAYVRNDPLSRVDPDGHADGEICQRYGGGACEGNGGGGGGGGGVDIPGWGDGANWQPPPGLLNPPGVPGMPGVVYPSGPAVPPPPNTAVPVGRIGVGGALPPPIRGAVTVPQGASSGSGVQPSPLPRGFGVSGSETVDLGLVYGAGEAGGVGVVAFPGRTVEVKPFANWGGFVGGPQLNKSYPVTRNAWSFGAFAGGGANLFVTNAASTQQFKGPFNVVNLNFGWRVRVFSAQFAWDKWGPNMTYVLSYGGPLPTGNIPTGVGYGLALSYYQTNTWVP
jgi:RHS repeat-associated protein